MDNYDFEAVERRAEAATPGPWYVSKERTVLALPGFYPILIANTAQGVRGVPDADFVAHSITDILALLTDRKRLLAENAELRAQLDTLNTFENTQSYALLGKIAELEARLKRIAEPGGREQVDA